MVTTLGDASALDQSESVVCPLPDHSVTNPSVTITPVDVHVADLTLATPVKLVVSGVDPVYAVSSDKKSLVYTVNSSGESSGIYVAAVPAL